MPETSDSLRSPTIASEPVVTSLLPFIMFFTHFVSLPYGVVTVRVISYDWSGAMVITGLRTSVEVMERGSGVISHRHCAPF